MCDQCRVPLQPALGGGSAMQWDQSQAQWGQQPPMDAQWGQPQAQWGQQPPMDAQWGQPQARWGQQPPDVAN